MEKLSNAETMNPFNEITINASHTWENQPIHSINFSPFVGDLGNITLTKDLTEERISNLEIKINKVIHVLNKLLDTDIENR